jgi:hypothetical protein
MKPFPRAAAAFVFAAGLVAGCGSKDPDREPVTGVVTFKGEPLSWGKITFTPVDSGVKTKGGATIKGGKFELPKAEGLHPGAYKVAVEYVPPPEPDRSPGSGEGPAAGRQPIEIPAKYNSDTELRADVKAGGPNALEFNLR